MIRYVIPALSAALLAAGGYAALERHGRLAAEARLELSQAQLATCGGRLRAILDDVRSDREIDAIPDHALRDVPPEWLLPPDASGD